MSQTVATTASAALWQASSLHQEINKPRSLSASVNQVVRYWLLPLLTETTEHEDQGMTATLLALPSFKYIKTSDLSASSL